MSYRTRLPLAALAVAFALVAGAQPAVEWSYNYGGGGYEEITAIVQAPGGGFLAVGHTTSDVSGTIAEPRSGSSDLLAVRMSRTGVKLWERVIGGASRDRAYDVIVDDRGRFIIVGDTRSGLEGTKTVDRQGPFEFNQDVYMVCLDAAGNTVWQAAFGGNGEHFARTVLQLDNGNYLVASETNADPSTQWGNRVEPLRGNFDYWVFEVDPNGQFVREHLYGGDQNDFIWGAYMLSDRTVMLYGASQSDVNGEKTLPGNGSSDMWLINIDQDGRILQQYVFGGTDLETPFFFTEYENGDLFVSGESRSPASGNKTSEWRGEIDLWAVRFDRASGNVIWDQTHGGEQDDYAYTGRKNINDYIVLAGTTRSTVRGDSVSTIRGLDDGWLIYLSPDGELIWDITQGGNERDNIRALIRSEDGGWYLGGESNSDPFPWRDAEAGGPYGMLDAQGIRQNDGWLAKLECDFEVEIGAEDRDLCLGEEVTIRNEIAVYLPHTTFLWSDGSTDSTYNSQPDADEVVVLQSVSPDACEASDTTLLDTHVRPDIADLIVEQESCSESRDGSLYVEVTTDAVDYTVNGEPYTAPQLFDSLSAGTYEIVANSTLERCAADTVIDLVAAGAFELDLGEDQSVVFGTTVTLDARPSTDDSLVYAWTGISGPCASCEVTSFRLLESGNVTVSATNAAGCTETATVFLEGTKDKRVSIPNAISPNNDGNNDRFFVFDTPFVAKLGPMRIYDRWGNLMFTGIEDMLRRGEGWDGRVDDEPVQSGVYTYVLQVEYIDGDTRAFQGELHVVY